MTIARGGQVGPYDLVQVLGEGGMGTVWLAHPHDAPDQFFAVKTVSAQYAADPRVCTMFVKEATLAAAIDHPNVVRLIDVGLHENVPFYVMEWIDGHSLRDVARNVVETGERVPASIALRIASDLCGGLHAAHELCSEDGTPLGLVHRDVSPHNVLVTMDGIAKLIDFGVAKARDLATGADASVAGGLKGKVRYMAPEQALEQEIDRRADLFSVGAVIYQLLTGRAPFEGPNELAIINHLLSTNPVYVPDDLPEPVQWILRKALARKPEQRFADAAEMQNAIELALVELGEPDTHADVATCLRWLDPRDEDEEITEQRDIPDELEPSTQLRAPVVAPHPSSGRQRASAAIALDGPPSSRGPASSRGGPVSSGPPSARARDSSRKITFPESSPRIGSFSPELPLAMASSSVETVPARQSSFLDEEALRPPHREHDRGSWRFVLMGAGFVGLLGLGAALLVHEGGDPPKRTSASATATPAVSSPPPPPPPLPSVAVTAPEPPVLDLGDLDDESKPQPARRTPRKARAPEPAKSGDLAGPVKVWK